MATFSTTFWLDPGRLRLRAVVHSSALIALLTLGVNPGVQCANLFAAEPQRTEASAEQEAFFETHVRPLLVAKCISCHGPKKQHAELRLDSLQSILEGGENGPAMVPFQPEESLIVEAVRRESFEMPPEEELKSEEVSVFEKWISAGAVWPKSSKNASSENQSDFENHWAFQPIRRPELPSVTASEWPRNEIDHFILRRLEEDNIAPSPPASAQMLLRRMKWDLLGLPLKYEETAAFDATNEQSSLDLSIDEYLASPHYGERWGRYWLDVARYADTKGYVFFEKPEFHNAFTYRDYVIQSFNNDKPFDQFVREQLAADLLGDELPNESLAALGFVTIGPHLKNDIHDIIADRIDAVSRGLMGLTIGCARCHDHKYDPVTIEDYYSLYGVFRNSIEPLHLPFRSEDLPVEHRQAAKELEEAAEALRRHYFDRYEQVLAEGRSRLEEYLLAAQVGRSGPDTTFFDVVVDTDDLNPELLWMWQQYLEDRDQRNDPVFLAWNRLAVLPENSFAEQATSILHELVASDENANTIVVEQLLQQSLTSFQQVVKTYVKLLQEVDSERPDQLALWQVLNAADSPLQTPFHAFEVLRLFPDRKSQEKVKELNETLNALRAKAPPELAQMLVLRDSEKVVESRVFKRGNPATLGDKVPRRFPQFFANVSDGPFAEGSGRLQLAQAIASKENPLTARVIVNRVWAQHFGQGLVQSPSNFGVQSEPPSHPELLDHLATWFIDHNWSIKSLHRYVMQSATYRQQSGARPELEQLDPGNRLCYRMNRRRLDFESMRDALLAVTGELDRTVGGRSVRGVLSPSNRRRTLYAYVDRQSLPSVMRMFDFPPPDVSSGSRDETSVPGQTLFLMNNPMVLAASRTLAERAEELNNAQESVRQLYRAILHREPESVELQEAVSFLQADEIPTNDPTPRQRAWSYGYASLDESHESLANLQPLPYWNGDRYQGGEALPDAAIGWVFLDPTGGHPGNDLKHVAVMRWTAPRDLKISISGTLQHEKQPGDGVRGHIYAAGHRIAGPWLVHQNSAETNIAALELQKGQTVDFVVDIHRVLSHDSFAWSPTISKVTGSKVTAKENAGAAAPDSNASEQWNYTTDFHEVKSAPITPLQNLAQVLLLSNEFHFVD